MRDRQSVRQTDRQADRQTDKQTDSSERQMVAVKELYGERENDKNMEKENV